MVIHDADHGENYPHGAVVFGYKAGEKLAAIIEDVVAGTDLGNAVQNFRHLSGEGGAAGENVHFKAVGF